MEQLICVAGALAVGHTCLELLRLGVRASQSRRQVRSVRAMRAIRPSDGRPITIEVRPRSR